MAALFDFNRYVENGKLKPVFVDVVIYLQDSHRIDLAEYDTITKEEDVIYLHSEGQYTCEVTKFKTNSIIHIREVLGKDERS